MYKNM